MSAKMLHESKKTQVMFASDTEEVELPVGDFTLECKGGDVWVFLGDQDRVLHEGEMLKVEGELGLAKMKKLYHRGHVKFKVTPIK